MRIYIDYMDTIIEGELLACGLDDTVLVRDECGTVWARLDVADLVLCEGDDFHNGGLEFQSH